MSAVLASLLDKALRRDDGQIVEALGRDISFGLLRDRATETERRLTERGLQADEPVHLAIGNRALDIAAMLGIWRAGGVAVPLHVAAQPTTLARARALTAARLVVNDGEVAEIGGEAPAARSLLSGAALILFTSGSTGAPKGVVLGHDALAGKLDVLDALLRFTPDDTIAVPLQMTFVFGIWASLLTLRAGARLVLVQRFSAPILSQILARGATVLAAVPSMLRAMRAEATGLSGSGPRLLLSGGEPLGPELRQAVAHDWPRTDVHDLYGLTETGSCDFCQPHAQDLTEAATIGRPTGQVAFRIAGLDVRDSGSGEAGELQVRTPFGMTGYLDDPALTESAFDRGYFRTGDLARLLPDGSVELVGRLKEIVSRGGNKIAPQEIDNLLCSHPAVAAALCAGVPDARLGEALHAVVVLKVGAMLDAEDLRHWVAERIERFKVPDVISIEEGLPVGPTGKASRALLRARAGNNDGERLPP